MKIDIQRRNREAVARLFRGIVEDFGEKTGESIIRHLVEQAGRIRIHVPGPGPDPLFRCGPCFRQLWRSTCEKFGRESGHAIMNRVMTELGNRRVWFPDHETLYRAERNRNIRALYNGRNGGELAARFNLCEDQIRKIVNKDEQNVTG